MSAETIAIRSVLCGLIVNTILSIIKIISGIAGNSYALIADGIESALDIFSSLIVWGGLKISSSPADSGHPYGHGKAESLAAIVAALLLIGGAIGISIESIREILIPHHAPAPFTLVVLVGVVTIKLILARFVFRVSQEANSTSLHADAIHHKSDAMTSAAAFFGISIALIGGEGYESADDFAALFASGVIGFNGYSIFRHALNEVMDSQPQNEIDKQVRALAEAVPGVRGIDECRVRKSGLLYLVDIHVMVERTLTVHDGHEIARLVRRTLSTSPLKIRDALVHIEPWEGEKSG